jgi:hypothetical protein
MDRNAVIIEDNGVQHELLASGRDWHLLHCKLFSEGMLFLDALGVYKNFTVARGIPTDSKAEVNRLSLCQVAEQFLAAVQRDIYLIQYDYSFSFTASPHKGSGAVSGFIVDGCHAFLSARPKGFCMLELMESSSNSTSSVVKQIDIRNKSEIKTDNWGILKIKKKKAKVTWPDVLPPMIEFLKRSKSETVVVHHK